MEEKNKLPSDQKQIIEQAKLHILYWEKLLKNKNDWRARKKQIDAITNQNKRLAALTNKDDDHKDNYKDIFEELVEERFDVIKELNNEINQNDLYIILKVILLERDSMISVMV